MNIKSFTFNPFQENTYIVYDDSKECIIIDPGCYTIEEQKKLTEFINEFELNPVKIINTHCHIDHVLGNKFISNLWNIKLYIHKQDLSLLKKAGEIGRAYGLEDYEDSPYPQGFLIPGELLTFGNSSFEIIFTPGHAPGHICLYSKVNSLLIAGDVIFKESIGRTDLPGGDYETLINSINTEILTLPDKTKIFCGHGPPTNLGYEKDHNPFLQ
tara:strand:+ start:27 stop:665 length:639 start_codon:yes stop_codon:yes gene_type:complete